MTPPRSFGPRSLVIATFAALTAGFLAGMWLSEPDPGTQRGPAPHPVGAEERIQLGMRALAAGDVSAAERLFREAARLRPNDPAPHADLAVALMAQTRWEEAAAELEIAKRYGPDAPEVHFLEGVLARAGLQDTTRARAAWQRFLALVPPEIPQATAVRRWIDDLAEGGRATPADLGGLLEEAGRGRERRAAPAEAGSPR